MRPMIRRAPLALALGMGAACSAASDRDFQPEPELAGQRQALAAGVSEDPLARSADWPSAGHDWAHTGHAFAETELGKSTVAGLDVVWQHSFAVAEGAEVPVIATAVAADGVAYIADVAGYAHARRLDDGTLLWTSAVSSARPEPLFRSVVQGGPVVTDDALYVGDSTAAISKVDRATGALLWAVDVEAHPDALIQGDLATAGPYVLFGVSSFENEFTSTGDLTVRGSVVAVDREQGQVAWRLYTTSDQSVATPRFGAGVGVWSSPAIDYWNSRLYIGTGQFYEPGSASPGCSHEPDLSDSLLSISLCDGGLVGSRQFTSGDVFGNQHPDGQDADVGAPPNLFDVRRGKRTVRAVGVGDKAGTYYALDRRTMSVLWSRRIAQGSVLGGFQSTAAFADGVLYVAAHERRDGRSLDTVIPEGEAAEFINSRDGLLTLQGDSRTHLVALDAASGAVLWERYVDGAATFAPLIVGNGLVFHGDAGGGLRVFDAASGEVLWQTQLGGFVADDGGVLGGNVITGLSLSRGRLLVSSLPLAVDSPSGLTAFGLAR
jgi:polyvinyl alcohol dehydrogenase (cytochrome)